jgi:hypothetical protein
MLALSIRQPYAEQILRGIKSVEYRSRPTNIRGRIYIYASLYRGPRDEETPATHGIGAGLLPRGFIVGTIEICGCTFNGDCYEWRLRDPRRLKRPRRPALDRRPNPVWFHPWRD